jgi:RNA recognition motif-containing protein
MIVVNAAKALRGLSLDDKEIEIKVTFSGDYNTDSSIFISKLADSVTESDLISEFA